MSIKRLLACSCLLVLVSAAPTLARSATQKAERYPCRDVHEFDFWAGTFDAKPWDKPDAPSGGQLHNTREYEGCAFVERWTSRGGNGMSMVFYDLTRKTWRMIWVDDSNQSSDFQEGVFKDGAMRFTGWTLGPDGVRVMASNVLENAAPDVIHHIFSTSSDSGKTWLVRSNGRFVRVKDAGSR